MPQRLEAHAEGARRLELALFRVDGLVTRISVGAGRPIRAPKLILALFREKFARFGDDLDAGFGFDMARLSVTVSAAADPAQIDLAGEAGAEADLDASSTASARVSARRRVGVIAPRDSHIPERAETLVPRRAHRAPPSRYRPIRPPEHHSRPLRLFARPEPVEAIAEVPDGPPVHFRWRRALYRIARAEGPERIAAEWWQRRRPDPRLFPRRGFRRPPLLALPRGPLRPRTDYPALVSPRGVRMSITKPTAHFSELAVTTNFSFLRGGSHPEELAFAAAELGLAGIAVADRNTLAGVVRAHVAAKEAGLPFHVGCRLSSAIPLQNEAPIPPRRGGGTARSRRRARWVGHRDRPPDIIAWPTDRAAYGRLCRLLTLGNRRAEKGQCHLDLADLLEWGSGMMLGVMPGVPRIEASLDETLAALRRCLPRQRPPDGGDDLRRRATSAASPASPPPPAAIGTPLLATNDVHYHVPERRPLQDVLTCIREKTTLATAGRLLAANAERHLKPPAEMARLFRDSSGSHRRDRARPRAPRPSPSTSCASSIPDEATGDAASPQEALEKLAEEGARYPLPERRARRRSARASTTNCS